MTKIELLCNYCLSSCGIWVKAEIKNNECKLEAAHNNTYGKGHAVVYLRSSMREELRLRCQTTSIPPTSMTPLIMTVKIDP